MELKKTVKFGKATAEITVTTVVVDKFLDGMKIGEETEAISKVVIIAPNGQAVAESSNATMIGDTTYVGKAATKDYEVGKMINNTIEEMENEILGNGKEDEELEIARNIIEQAEKQGIDKLMTNEEYYEWKSSYNNVMNEGGEGYILNLVTKEQYEKALETINKK